MDWDRRFLEALRGSRTAYDDQPDWRSALSLYDLLAPEEQEGLDRAVLGMVDVDYRNPFSSREDQPFDDVMVNLPAGMAPDDLLCIEAAVLVAAERGLGAALFSFNRLLRLPIWHAIYPRLEWLSQQGFEAQRKLSATVAGRYLGAILGLAAGDALGATLEFKSRSQVRQEYPDGLRDIVGGGPWRLEAGECTDDTAMTLAVARGIVESPADPIEAVGKHFMEWYEGNPPDVGNTCRLALESYRRTHSWEAASGTVARTLGGQAGGNGALMRTLPTPLAYGKETDQAVRIAHMTHPHPESDAAILVYHSMVDALVRTGASRTDAFAAGLAVAGPLRDRLERVPGLNDRSVLSSGYVVDTLEAAIWSFLTTDSLEECVIRAANLGDDADTVGAVAGGLAGAYYGSLGLPRRWSMTLRGRAELEEVAGQLFAVSHP